VLTAVVKVFIILAMVVFAVLVVCGDYGCGGYSGSFI
jgi:L-asparagine transporter-like permease